MSSQAVHMRSYRHQVPATKGKVEWLRAGLFADYSAAANALSAWLNTQWLRYFETLEKGDRPMRLIPGVPAHIKEIGGTTVAQQAYANSVYPAFVSKIGNVVGDIRVEINALRQGEDAPDTDTLKALYYLNKSRRWLDHHSDLPDEWGAWLADVFWKHWTHGGLPNFGDNIVYLDQRNLRLRESRVRHFERWARITHRKHGFEFPVGTNPYADRHEGVQKGQFRLYFNRDNDRIEADLIKAVDFSDARESYADGLDAGREVALDFGMTSLFTTDAGHRYGAGMIDYLTGLDRRIQRIQAECQRRGYRLSRSKRYRKLVRRMREHLTCRVNEALNRIVTVERPSILIVERLDFHSPNLSRRMNRLVQNCGRKAVANKLVLLQQELGIDYIEVNPAYSSQTCSRCGYVDRKNRSSRDNFKCRFCDHKDCADTNAAINIRTRRSWPEWLHHAHRRIVLNRLVSEFVQRNNGVLAGSAERIEALNRNTYFRKALDAEVDPDTGGVEESLQ
ncbi:MAG TPA: transposase [Mariprofundaceae bacterium]|nr:transposase [Mariprofundaceae bacterium]